MSARRPVLTPDHPAPAAAHRQAGYPHSLAGIAVSDHHPPAAVVVIWPAACGGAAPLIATPARSGRAAAPSSGPATGPLFDRNISAKPGGYRGPWLAARTTLIAAGAARTSVLQSACQPGEVRTVADAATIMTTAVPITAGFVPFGKRLPHGIQAVLQPTAFARPVARAVAPGRQQTPGSEPHCGRRVSTLGSRRDAGAERPRCAPGPG